MTPAPSSRYFGLPTATVTAPDGRAIVYLLRRFLPDADPAAPGFGHPVRAGDRLDLLAAQYLGDPELFWRIADANRAMDPEALTPPPGAVPAGPPRRVLIPQIGG